MACADGARRSVWMGADDLARGMWSHAWGWEREDRKQVDSLRHGAHRSRRHSSWSGAAVSSVCGLYTGACGDVRRVPDGEATVFAYSKCTPNRIIYTPPFQTSNTTFASGRAQPTGLWSRSPRPSWPFVGTSKCTAVAAPRRRPLWSSSAARRWRCLVTFVGDTVEQLLVGRVDGCAARSMRVCMPEVGTEQPSPWP